jgi:hypothetical protein
MEEGEGHIVDEWRSLVWPTADMVHFMVERGKYREIFKVHYLLFQVQSELSGLLEMFSQGAHSLMLTLISLSL